MTQNRSCAQGSALTSNLLTFENLLASPSTLTAVA